MSKQVFLDFYNASGNDAATKEIKKLFSRAGTGVVKVEVATVIKRSSNISYRSVHLTFADSQVVSLCAKATGDVFQVQLNGKNIVLKAQNEPEKIVTELVAAMDQGRAKFQAALSKVAISLPAAILTAVPTMLVALQQQEVDLDAAIDAANTRKQYLKAQLEKVAA